MPVSALLAQIPRQQRLGLIGLGGLDYSSGPSIILSCAASVSHLLVPNRVAVGVDLDIGIIEPPDSSHCSEILGCDKHDLNHMYHRRAHTVSHDRFSCMKMTTCSMSFKDPAAAGLTPKSTAKAILESERIAIIVGYSCIRKDKTQDDCTTYVPI